MAWYGLFGSHGINLGRERRSYAEFTCHPTLRFPTLLCQGGKRYILLEIMNLGYCYQDREQNPKRWLLFRYSLFDHLIKHVIGMRRVVMEGD